MAHDAVDHALHPFGFDGTLAQSDLHRALKLVPVEGHAAARALDDDEFPKLHPLEGREATPAIGANAARRIADASSVGRESFLGVEAPAIGAAHDLSFRLRRRSESAGSLMHLGLYGLLERGVVHVSVPRQAVEGFDDELADAAELAGAKPREVAAGVPSRIPEVTIGFSGSKGTPFLLHVM